MSETQAKNRFNQNPSTEALLNQLRTKYDKTKQNKTESFRAEKRSKQTLRQAR